MQVYIAISRKVVGKNVHGTIPKGNMEYDQYAVPDPVAVKTYFNCFPSARANTRPRLLVPSFQISFSEEQRTQNHPQYLSWLSCALFPTTFLEIAVHILIVKTRVHLRTFNNGHLPSKQILRQPWLSMPYTDHASLVDTGVDPLIAGFASVSHKP